MTLKEDIDAGIAQAERGELVDGEEAFANVEKAIDNFRTASEDLARAQQRYFAAALFFVLAAGLFCWRFLG